MLKVLELFGGIGATTAALKNLGVGFEIVDYVDIDKYATLSYNAINSTSFEPQDITKWDKDLDIDLIVHGSPCQDFSVAGRNAGGDKGSGTRSSLMWETIRIVQKLKPTYVIWENVKGVLSKKNKHNFDLYQKTMSDLGYKNYVQILNAKDYGVPQNRERVFTVSILWDMNEAFSFRFPEPKPLTVRLKDILESEVDERYYLSEKSILHYNRDFGSKGKVQELDGYCDTLQAAMGSGGGNTPIIIDAIYNNREPRVYDDCSPTLRAGRFGLDVIEPKIVASRGRGESGSTKQNLELRKDGLTNTITSVQKDNYLLNPNSKIRKLTPKECWRLMGRSDEDFEKAEKVCSNTQLYKQAGNSIVVNVMQAILERLLK